MLNNIRLFIYFLLIVIQLTASVMAQPYLPHELLNNEIELLKREFDKAETDKIDDPRVQLMRQDLYYKELPFVLPKEFKIIGSYENLAAGNLVDNAYRRILSTKTGKNICDDIFNGGTSKEISNILGVSTTKVCKRNPKKISNTHIDRGIRDDGEWYFILIKDKLHPIQSWTNNKNLTFVFITENDLNTEFFLRVFSHEMALKLDGKERLGVYSFNENMPENISFDLKKQCQINYALKNPIIKFALSTIRATKIENKILSELGFSSENKIKSCKQNILEYAYPLGQVLSILHTSLEVSLSYLAEECNRSDKKTVEQIVATPISKSIETIETNSFNTSKGVVNICEYMSEPLLRSFPPTALSSGPKPRVTGGWSKIEDGLNSDEEKLLMEYQGMINYQESKLRVAP
jgi:hypothetical protein